MSVFFWMHLHAARIHTSFFAADFDKRTLNICVVLYVCILLRSNYNIISRSKEGKKLTTLWIKRGFACNSSFAMSLTNNFQACAKPKKTAESFKWPTKTGHFQWCSSSWSHSAYQTRIDLCTWKMMQVSNAYIYVVTCIYAYTYALTRWIDIAKNHENWVYAIEWIGATERFLFLFIQSFELFLFVCVLLFLISMCVGAIQMLRLWI